jgi:uncharacterized membrane protein
VLALAGLVLFEAGLLEGFLPYGLRNAIQQRTERVFPSLKYDPHPDMDWEFELDFQQHPARRFVMTGTGLSRALSGKVGYPGGNNMKDFLAKLRDITVSGILALLPLYVFFVVIKRAWKALSSIASDFAQVLGMKYILGVGGATVFSVLLIVAIWVLTGLLVRYSFLSAISKAAEKQLSKYIPDYDSYKAKAEEKLRQKVAILPYTSALIKWEEYWQPGYIVEQDQEGNCVVFLPEIPETIKGHILLARQDQVRVVESVTANQLDASLKKTGKGLLSDYGIHIPPDRRATAGRP